jgi:hypothetical protein
MQKLLDIFPNGVWLPVGRIGLEKMPQEQITAAVHLNLVAPHGFTKS